MFRCDFCGRVYQRESSFLNHTCEQRERHLIMETPIGQSAYQLYKTWWTLKKRVPPAVSTFIKSSQFKPFIKFAQFVKRTKLNTKVYMNMVTEASLSPDLWTRDEVYVRYLEYIDKTVPSDEQIKMCVDYVLKLTDALECDTSEIFNYLLPPEVQQLVRDRKLSPWILLHSKAFKVWLISQTDDVQLRLQDLIRPMYWKLRFQREHEAVAKAKQVAKALGI